MACREIDQMRSQVMDRLGASLNGWHRDLQSRYGDPRVYENQRVHQLRAEAALVHDMSRRQEAQEMTHYQIQSRSNSEAHKTRLAKLNVRFHESDTPPESGSKTPRRSRTPKPRPEQAPPPPPEPAPVPTAASQH